MIIRDVLTGSPKSLLPVFSLGALIAGVAAPAYAALPNCSTAALSAVGIPNTTIVFAQEIPAVAPNPAYCDVIGSVTTTGEGAPNGSARFELKFPATWNRKFLFWGTGGEAGILSPTSANPQDIENSLQKGYATAVTDTGHVAPGGNILDSSYALNLAARLDYWYRAVHQVTLAAKPLVQAFFKASIERAYFDGCSNGGRMGLMEAMRYPDDYDAVIAGAPYMDLHTNLAWYKALKAELVPPSAYIPASLLPTIDAAVKASCNAADAVEDGLIHNPARCGFRPEILLCRDGNTSSCLTPDQVAMLRTYLGPVTDSHGRTIFPGMTVSDLSAPGGMSLWFTGAASPSNPAGPEPWNSNPAVQPLAWTGVEGQLKYRVEQDPNYEILRFGESNRGVVSDDALRVFDEASAPGEADYPIALARFLQRGGILLMYHGFSDQLLSPYRTELFYAQLGDFLLGNYSLLQRRVQLYMVPGMLHCGGGPGPHTFDTLTPLENWVERGVVPNRIVATKYVSDDPAQGVSRTMPLCSFPTQAHYTGVGDINDAANWSCRFNQDLLRLGPTGIAAGLAGDLDVGDVDRSDQ